MCKKIICAVLTLVLLIGLVPVTAIPASAAESGKCGANLTWEVQGNRLIIEGSGKMEFAGGKIPWQSDIDHLTAVRFVLRKPITLAANAFSADYPALVDVEVNDLGLWAMSSMNGNGPLSNGDKPHKLYESHYGDPDAYLKYADIPYGTSYISDDAFKGARILGVGIPSSVEYIGDSAFESCLMLKDLNIANGVKYIGINAFSGCQALQSVSLPASVESMGSGAFQNCGLTSASLSATKIEHLPDAIFRNCSKLSSVSLPQNLNFISGSMFENCSKLTNINIPGKVAAIGDAAFKNCPLEHISFPASVKRVAASAFTGCSAIRGVSVPNLETWINMDIQGVNPLITAKHLYVNGEKQVTLVIPGSIEDIPANRFQNLRDVTKLVIPNSVRTIGAGAFKDCENLKEVIIGDSLHTIGDSAFANCLKLEKVTVEKSQWQNLMTMGSGNNDLIKAYDASHSKPADPAKPTGTQKDVSDNIVNVVANMVPFHENAYEYPAGTGKYLIGYGTSSIKGAKITRAEAKKMLKEEGLPLAAGTVFDKFPAVAALNGKAATKERDALAAYSFMNGYNWMDNSGHPLYKAVTGSTKEYEFLEAICAGSKPGSAEFNNRLCLGNVYVNGKYSNTVPAHYGYVVLDPNGGKAVRGSFVIYNLNGDATPLKDTYNPSQHYYEFLGWFTQKETGKLVSFLDKSVNKMTLYAHWQHHDNIVPNGKPVSYKLPTVMVKAPCLDDSGRVKVFAAPNSTEHIQTLENNILMDIVAEYRDGSSNLWVKIRNSGWVSLGQMNAIGTVESGTVKLKDNQRLNVFETVGGAKLDASLRNENLVSIVERQKVDKKTWGKVWFLDTQNDVYKTGWIDLTYVNVDPIPGPNDPVDPDSKEPIAKGVVVNTDNVNVRGLPNVYGQFYSRLPRGSKVSIYEYATTNGVQWALADEGWVCMQYVKVTEDSSNNNEGSANQGGLGSDKNTTPLAHGKVIGNLVLTIRNAPGAHNKSVGTLAGGTEMSIFQTKMFNGAQWGRMEKGWVCLTYVKLDGDLVVPEGQPGGAKPAGLGQAKVVNCSTHVNVRANATPQSALQGTYPLGTVIELEEQATTNGFEWFRTTKGWVCGTYLQKIDAPVVPGVPEGNIPVLPGTATTGTITGNDNVNVREAPGTFNAKVGSLRSGSRVNIKGSKTVDGATWYQIDQGWVAGEYVLLGGNGVPESNGTPTIGGTTQTTDGKFATGTIAQAGTKVRTGPGYGYKDVKSLALGEKVTVYEQQLLDGVAWGRINNANWVNLAFVTLDSTGITGTGAIGTIARCGHAANIRRGPSTDGAQMATILLGATVEVLETKDMGTGGVWGRTPQGWINMQYIQLTGEIPAPPLNPDVPAPQPEGNTPAPETPKPSNQGIPFDMKGTINPKDTSAKYVNLQIIPGELGEYDAKIEKDKAVVISKLDQVDGKTWGLVEGGWVKIEDLKLSNYVVSKSAQIVWKDANTNEAFSVINKGDVENIAELKMDDAKKVWGRIVDKTNTTIGWIELTQITELGNFSNSFYVKTTVSAETEVYTYSDSTSAKLEEKIPASTMVQISGLARDSQDPTKIMLKVEKGWILASTVNMSISAVVTPEMVPTWDSAERTNPSGNFLKQGGTVTIAEFGLKSTGLPMARIGANEWIELSALATP